MSKVDISNEELTQYLEVWEQINADIKAERERLKEHKQQVKSAGYDTKICAKIIRDRARSKDAIAEEEALLEVYKQALGE
jgi:uncharacterized protein (UPF0335 family)